VSEGDASEAIDRYIERVARAEQDDMERAHGQFILEVATGKPQQEDPLLSALNEAWRQATEAEADQQ
jgi:hypothetical protein